MTSATKTAKELLVENEKLRLRLDEAEETLRALGSGEVDAFVVSGPDGEKQVYTLKGAELPYRILVESMNEGAATLAADGTILYCNKRLSSMLKISLGHLIGTNLGSYVESKDHLIYAALLENCTQESISEEIVLKTVTGNPIPVFMSCCTNDISGTQGISVVITDLTLQRRNTEILASEKFSTSIIEQSREVMIVCDTKGKIIRASQSAHVLCGTNPLMKEFNKIFPLQITETGKKFSIVHLKRTGNITSIEVEFKRDDKQIFNLLLNATTLKSFQNRDIGCVVNLSDITSRKTAELELQLSEVRLQSAYSHLQVVNEELQVASEELQVQSEELQSQNQELQDLWERSKQSEKAIRISEERLALAVSATRIGMFDLNIAKGTLLWTQTHEAIFGYAPAITTITTTTEHSQRRWTDRIHPDDQLRIEEESLRCMQERKPLEVQYRIIWPDGSMHWVETKGVYQYESDGKSSRMIGVIMDITERKQAEKELFQKEERLRLALDAAKMATWDWHVPSGAVIWNEMHHRMMGYAPGEVQPSYLSWANRVHPDDFEAVQKRIQESMNGGTVFTTEFRTRWPDGTVRWLEACGETEYSANNEPQRQYGVMLDITERKQAEEDLRQQSERALLLSEKEFLSLAEAVPQIVWATLPDGGNIYFNQQWMDYTGLTIEESYGHGWITPFHPDDKQRAWDAWQRATQHNDHYSLECRIRRSDGVYRWWLTRGEPMLGSKGEILKWFGTCTDIEELKCAELALQAANNLLEQRVDERTMSLRESEQQFSVLIQNLKSAVALINEIGEFTIVNQAFFRIFELNDDSSIMNVNERDWGQWKVFNEEGSLLDVDEHPVRKAALTGGPVRDKLVAVKAPESQELKWLLVSVEPIMDARGQIHRLICTYHDITARKLAEDALRESEERFRLALKNSPVSVATQDRNLVYQWAYNQQSWRTDEIIGKTDADLFAPEEVDWINEIKQRVLESGNEEHVAHWVTSNGKRLFLDFTYEPLRYSGGEIIGIGVAAVNLTSQKLAEQALCESEEQLRTLADSIPNLAWWANSDGYITWYNRRWYEYTGTTPEQMEGGGWQSVHDPAELPNVLERWHASLATSQPFDMTFPLRGADGVFRPFLTRIIPLKDTAGCVQQWFGTNTDVSDLEQRVAERTKELAVSIDLLQGEILERELAEKKLLEETAGHLQATETLREKERMLIQQSRLAAIGQLAGGMAHEVRNPLNAILSISEALFKEKGVGDNPEYEPYINHIRAQVNRLAHLMNDLLELGKPIPITSLYPVPLHEVCKDAIKLMELSGVAKEHRISAEWGAEPGSIKILVDSVKLQQVIANLLENAIQHSPKGCDVELQLAVSQSDHLAPEMAVIRVCDRGCGIPADLINHVFEPFYSTRKGGTGLGLALVRHFVENMGGRVIIWNNDPLPGCTAEVRIPIAKEEQV